MNVDRLYEANINQIVKLQLGICFSISFPTFNIHQSPSSHFSPEIYNLSHNLISFFQGDP